MNEQQQLFLLQARSDFAVFQVLNSNAELPKCHALHYLQMASEMLGKASLWKHGQPRNSHRAFVALLRSLITNREAQAALGFKNVNANWQRFIRTSVLLAERVEDLLAPALSPDAPNAEYPWPRDLPAFAPADHDFAIAGELANTAAGRRFLKLIDDLFTIADSVL